MVSGNSNALTDSSICIAKHGLHFDKPKGSEDGQRGLKETIADYAGSVKYAKQREPLLDEATELRRPRGMYENSIVTPNVKSTAPGEISKLRLEAVVVDASRAFNLKVTPNPDQIFSSSYLPPCSDRNYDRRLRSCNDWPERPL